ncbi:MAG: glycosyltransferase family 2 protein [Candidatus Eisenbacteria bacterium]
MSPRRCVAIVVTYESRQEISACLDALGAQTGGPPEIWVVDNASKDGTVGWVRAQYPGVRVIANAENVGFACANNQVLESESADVFVLANPDAVPSPGAVAAAVDVLDAQPDVAIVAPRLVHPDGTLQPSAHAFLGLLNLFGETFGLDRLFPRSALGSFHMRGFAHDERRDVDWIQGAFLVVRGSAVGRVGAFDPAYFMYGEEMDWCRRMKRAGYRVVFLPEPSVMHIGGASSRTLAGPMFVELLKSRLRFFDRQCAAWTRGPARILVAIATLGRWFAWELASRLPTVDRTAREKRALRIRMFRAGVRWVLAGLPVSAQGRAR